MNALAALILLSTINETTPLFQQRGLTTCSVKENEMAELILGGVRYRTIPNFSRYMAGEDGSVGSIYRIGNRPIRILRTYVNGYGYLSVTLVRDDGKAVSKPVHRMVLLAFVGEPPQGQQACHYDGDRLNAKLSNLRWDTPKGNNADKLRHGTQQRGSKVSFSVLTEDDVAQVKQMLVDGSTCKEIAEVFGVTREAISRIRALTNWREVRADLNGRFAPRRRHRKYPEIVKEMAKQSGLCVRTICDRLKSGVPLDLAASPVRLESKYGKRLKIGTPEYIRLLKEGMA